MWSTSMCLLILMKRILLLCFSFDVSNFSKQSRKTPCFPLIQLKKKEKPNKPISQFSARFRYWKIFIFIWAFPNNYDIFNAPLSSSGRHKRCPAAPKAPKPQESFKRVQPYQNKGNTINKERNHCIWEGKMRHSHMNQNALVPGTKTDTNIP